MKHWPLLVVLAGCADAIDDELGEIESEVTGTNKLAANKLAANSMKASSLADSDLVETVEGREVLSYIISCALPAGQSITLDGTYKFDGSLGLAPAWATRAPTRSERRWVSACVLARTNLYGVRVEISMRGSHPALSGTLAERLDYLLVEGAFYGDLFDETGPKLYACSTEVRDLDLALSTQELRACATSSNGHTTHCGFTYTGKCGVADVSLAPACHGVVFPYQRCRTGRGHGDEIYREVITVSLATALWTDAHPIP